MAEAADITELRLYLGEPIPEGGTAADTMFTDSQVGKWFDEAPNMDAAAYRGWKAKKAHFANLVNVTDGAASREMSDLLKNADNMIVMYRRTSVGVTAGRSRVGKIVRSE